MKTTIFLIALAALTVSGAAAAQADDESEIRRAEIEYAERLAEAERQMAEAARRVAELTSERLPQIRELQMKFMTSDRPMIGISIDGDADSGPVEGIEVIAVSPGTAADDAGLRTGDIITSVNDEPLTAPSSMAANELLFDFMDGVEEGDVLEIEYLRNGNQAVVELAPRKADKHAFAWRPGDGEVIVERFGRPHEAPHFAFDFRFPWGSAWGTMELVELNEGLGKYFGTDKGLLVVSAPEPDAFGLEDGDVIVTIDGREPRDVRHALKILGSYDSGEELELGIMREQKERTLEIEIPADDYRG